MSCANGRGSGATGLRGLRVTLKHYAAVDLSIAIAEDGEHEQRKNGQGQGGGTGDGTEFRRLMGPQGAALR